MLIAIHQLHYLPWLRYIHKLASADIFIVLDNIQFNKNGWQNRNRIKTAQGVRILTVPVLHKFAQNLDEVTIDNKQPWQRKHWGAIQNSYRKAPYFSEHEPFLKRIYETSSWDKLNDLNYEMLFYFVKVMGIKTKILKGCDIMMQGEATDRLVYLCQFANENKSGPAAGTTYLTGAFAAGQYLDTALFEKAGIQLAVQGFTAPEYPQLHPDQGFIPELSVLDLLLNCGTRSLEMLMNSANSRSGAS